MAHSRGYQLLALAVAGGAGAGATLALQKLGISHREPDQLVGGKLLVAETIKPTFNLVHDSHTFEHREPSFDKAIMESRKLIHRFKEEMGIPGLSIAVNLDGHTVWSEGFGFADLENGVRCRPDTVMRIASISKSMTMTALAKLWEEGKIDLDKPVQKYVPNFPQKTFDGKPVEITTRMLTNHFSGIRHWKKIQDKKGLDGDNVPDGKKKEKSEFYLNEHFENVEQALDVFKEDNLEHKPGTKYLYSTPAWTLISAVMEKAAGTPYPVIMKNMFRDLGLHSTRLDENDPIVLNRARYYNRYKQGRLVNAPCVDNSCKWAGGGLLSTVEDLVKFVDAMVYCLQQKGELPGYLREETIRALWNVTPESKQNWGRADGYGMGWMVVPELHDLGGVERQTLIIGHTGGAVGASSIVLAMPQTVNVSPPAGISVAIIANLESISLQHLGMNIAKLFAKDN